MRYLTQLFIIAAISMATSVLTSCVSTQYQENTGTNISGSQDVWLSQTDLKFDFTGGQTAIEIQSYMSLSLTNPYSTEVKKESDISQYFAGNGNPLDCVKSIQANLLIIKVNKSETRQTQYEDIKLYDEAGVVRATVHITQTGDPRIGRELGTGGQNIVAKCSQYLSNALSTNAYIERCYTGLMSSADVQIPLTANHLHNTLAFQNATQAVRELNSCIASLTAGEIEEETPFYTFLKSIVYTEMADRWGNVAILERANDSIPLRQITATELLEYVHESLDSIEYYFEDVPSPGFTADMKARYQPSKDLWRMAMATVNMQLGKWQDASELLQQIVNSGHYSITEANSVGLNPETIWMLDETKNNYMEQQFVYYCYPQTLLMLAECKARLGDNVAAAALIGQVAATKGVELNAGDGIIDNINTLWQSLWLPNYFAFQKRNSLGNYHPNQHLWPIPAIELGILHQNPGY